MASSKLTKGLTEEQVETLNTSLKEGLVPLTVLVEYLEREIKACQVKRSSHLAYDKPGWQGLQAHINGEEEANKALLDVLTKNK